jgi:hypothetical protein
MVEMVTASEFIKWLAIGFLSLAVLLGIVFVVAIILYDKDPKDPEDQ